MSLEYKFDDDPAIGSGVIAFFVSFRFWPLGGKAKNQIGLIFGVS
jgi:hypothetical protein